MPGFKKISKEEVRRILDDNKADIAVVTLITGCTVMGIWGSPLVSNAIILAVATTTGLVFLIKKLPGRIQAFLVRMGFFSDVIAAVLTYWMLGKTLTAMLAAAFVGIFISVGIHYAREKQAKDLLVEVIAATEAEPATQIA